MGQKNVPTLAPNNAFNRLNDTETRGDILIDVARGIVRIWTDYADGEPLDQLDTLLHLARSFHCYVVAEICAGSSYCRVKVGQWSGAIHLDILLDPDDMVRALAHELAHHTIATRSIRIPGERGVIEIHDLALAEETICRIAAEIIIAVPQGLLWNGKLALPKGPGRIPIYTRLPVILPSQSMRVEEMQD